MDHIPVEVIGNILDICGRQKLELLVLARNSITGVEPNYKRFPFLKSLSLSYVSISSLDLNLLLTAFPKIQFLGFVSPEIAITDAQVTVELTGQTLKKVYVKAISLDKFSLEADNLEKLHIEDCAFELFELTGKGILKHFKMHDCFLDLRYLALSYDLRDDFKEGVLHYSLQGESPLENVRVLDIGMNPNSINGV
ncbi:hypothetical protein L1887_31094 [Cichorium endivia]|nr:hypothetical protein L1887_31094 [Cichorium endivia]